MFRKVTLAAAIGAAFVAPVPAIGADVPDRRARIAFFRNRADVDAIDRWLLEP